MVCSSSEAASRLPASALQTGSPPLFPMRLRSQRGSLHLEATVVSSFRVLTILSFENSERSISPLISGMNTSGLSRSPSRFLSNRCCISLEACFIPRIRIFLRRFLSPGKLTSAGGFAIVPLTHANHAPSLSASHLSQAVLRRSKASSSIPLNSAGRMNA